MTIPPDFPARAPQWDQASIDEAAGELTACERRVNAIAERRRAIRDRLSQIENRFEIQEAIADGDADRVAELKAERAALESENRDLEGGERIAMDRQHAARSELRRRSVAKLYAELERAYRVFESLVRTSHKEAVALAAQIKATRENFNGSGLGRDHELNPVRLELSPLALGALQTLSSFTLPKD